MIAMRLLVEADTSCDINISLFSVLLFIYIHINVGVSVIAIYFRNSSEIKRWGLGLLSAVIMSGFKTAFLLRRLFPTNDTTKYIVDPSLWLFYCTTALLECSNAGLVIGGIQTLKKFGMEEDEENDDSTHLYAQAILQSLFPCNVQFKL